LGARQKVKGIHKIVEDIYRGKDDDGRGYRYEQGEYYLREEPHRAAAVNIGGFLNFPGDGGGVAPVQHGGKGNIERGLHEDHPEEGAVNAEYLHDPNGGKYGRGNHEARENEEIDPHHELPGDALEYVAAQGADHYQNQNAACRNNDAVYKGPYKHVITGGEYFREIFKMQDIG